MPTEATLNVRFPNELGDRKRRGDAVLAKAGISTSQAIRGLYRHLDETQSIPSWLQTADDVYEKRRKAMRKLVGIAPIEDELDDVRTTLKEERLSRLEF